MPIVSVKDVEQLSGKTFSSADAGAVAALIIYVQNCIESFLSRAIEIREFEETVTVNWNQSPPLVDYNYAAYTQLFLVNTPVKSVSQVSVNGAVIDPVNYAINSMGIIYFGLGVEFNLTTSNWLSLPVNEFTVAYQGGLDGRKNETFKFVLINTVLRELAKIHQGDAVRAGAQSIKVEDYSVAYQPSTFLPRGAVGQTGPFLPQEVKLLQQYMKRTVIS